MKKLTLAEILTIAISIVVITILAVILINNIKADKAAEAAWIASREVIQITIEPGDTLSGLYYQYAPKGIDMFPWINQIEELNNMSSSDIYVGDKLLIYIN